MIRFRAPIRRDGQGFVVNLSDDEADIVARLLGELRTLLTDPDPEGPSATLTERLFPVVHRDPEEESEYQRWMRPELVQSKLTAITTVEEALAGDGRLDEGGMIAFMQAVNSVRLVLGVMLGITDDDQPDDDDPDSPYEMQLYVYLSWLLEWSVRALSGR